MSVRHSLLALLSAGPMYGAQLRSEFESRTAKTWSLNIGQVYTTLARLERDGLVHQLGEHDDDKTIEYALTEAGIEEVRSWWQTPAQVSSD